MRSALPLESADLNCLPVGTTRSIPGRWFHLGCQSVGSPQAGGRRLTPWRSPESQRHNNMTGAAWPLHSSYHSPTPQKGKDLLNAWTSCYVVFILFSPARCSIIVFLWPRMVGFTSKCISHQMPRRSFRVQLLPWTWGMVGRPCWVCSNQYRSIL